MPDLESCYLPAGEALARFRARTRSPAESRGALIERAETVEPTVCALFHRHFAEAMAKARKAEALYADARTQPSVALPGDSDTVER